MIEQTFTMHWSLVLALLCAGAVLGADSPLVPPEMATLGLIKAHMAGILARQPDYTCTQQIERSSRLAPNHQYELRDMLRLDVALVGGKELYAWPGAPKFDDTELTDMAPPGGAIGTGNFATHARAVFASGAPRFTYAGIVPYDGRSAYRYTFVVPQIVSGWRVKVNGDEAIVGYHGSFLADSKTLDVVRLEVVADDIPERLGLKSTDDAMEYRRRRIGDGDFLLPMASELRMIDSNGNESRNRAKFTACRQFSGESVLTFADPDEAPDIAPAAVVAPKTSVVIPANMEFEVSLDSPVDSGRSMVGDAVTATLQQNIGHRHHLLFRKGAKLIGRILRLERHGDHCEVDIRFSELESANARSAVNAHLETNTDQLDYQPLLRSLIQTSTSVSTSHRTRRNSLRLHGRDVHLPRGFRLRLRTDPAPAEVHP